MEQVAADSSPGEDITQLSPFKADGGMALWAKIVIPLAALAFLVLGGFLNHVVELTTTQTQQNDQIKLNTARLDRLESWQRDIDARLIKIEDRQTVMLDGILDIKQSLKEHDQHAARR